MFRVIVSFLIGFQIICALVMALIIGHSQVKYFKNYVQNSATKCLFFSGCKVGDLLTFPAVVAAIPTVSVSILLYSSLYNLEQSRDS